MINTRTDMHRPSGLRKSMQAFRRRRKYDSPATPPEMVRYVTFLRARHQGELRYLAVSKWMGY